MKKIINILIAVILLLNLMSITIFAEDISSKTYVQNGYTIDYDIANSWANNQNITVTIKNTGIEAIDNWMLEYDFKGNIVEIWNAITVTDNSSSEYVKNAGYNAVIEPDGSAVFGYTLENAAGFPDSIVMCQEESVKENGYSIELKVIDEWDDNFNGEIIITNMTDKPIECWKLSFDSNFTIVEITDSWAASIIYADEGNYTLKGTYTNIIYGNSSVSIGFIGKKSGTPKIIDFSLTETNKANNFNNSGNGSDLIDIGQIYFKDIQSEDDIEYDGDGIYYVRDQLLLTARDNITFDDIESYAASLNAEIVGYIELTNDYQIEFNSEMTTDDLYQLIEEFGTNQIVEYASLNTVLEIDEDYMPQDYDWWNGKNPSNVDWGIKAIKADTAWGYFDKNNEENDNRYTVKLGLIDKSFNESHNDLNFKYTWENVDETDEDEFHGTHVAGIMAAKFNNQTDSTVVGNVKNIAGICPENELYAVSISNKASVFEYKYSLALLIGNNVRVINISQNSGHEECYGASNNKSRAERYIKTNAEIIDNFLKKLINKNYDFLIVTSAGNVNGMHFSPVPGGFKENKLGAVVAENAEALYNSFFNFINSEVQDRIICVGSIGHKYVNNNVEYYFNSETCIGNRVDVVAPGVNIYSTVPGNSYDKKSGTSMAAPHVSGIAGMMYSINPNLTAEQVKNIIVSTATQKICAADNSYTYGLVDAKAAVDKVLGVDNDIYEEKTNGIILGKVVEKVNNNDKDLKDVNIIVYENTGSEIRKVEDIEDEKTNEKGEYEFVLPAGDYVIEFVKDKYVTHREKVNVIENMVNKIAPITLIEGRGTSVKDEKSNEFLSDVKITVKLNTVDDFTEKETEYKTNESGEFVFTNYNSDYTISFIRDGYNDKILEVKAKDGLLYDKDDNHINEILMTPIDIRIQGVVEKYNKKTSETKPLGNYTVTIYEKSQSAQDEDEFFIKSTQTDSKGYYEVKLDSYGEYIVKFDDANQKHCSVNSNGTHTVNMVFKVDEESENNNNNNGNTSSSDSAEVKDDIVISTEIDDPSKDAGNDNTTVTGIWGGDLKKGIYIDCGEYTYHYYVADYKYISAEIWTAFHTNLLKYDVYKNGMLIEERTAHFWHERVVYSYDYNVWIHTKYISSVGVKKVEIDGEYRVCLTYTLKDVWNPGQGNYDRTNEYTIYLTGSSDTVPTIRSH